MAKELSKTKLKKKTLSIVRDYLSHLKRKIKIKEVILFGSHARGEAGKDSDIDLIIISPDFKGMEFMGRLIFLNRLRREMKKSAPMDIFGYTSEELERFSKEFAFLEEAKREGVTVK